MKILLTGAAGFIGSHLVERFLQEGHQVIGLDSFFTGRKQNIASFLSHTQFQFFKADCSDPLPASVLEAAANGLDWILHFASPASPPKYFKMPLQTMRVNAEGTRHLLELAKQKGAQFFYASTSEVYGDPLVHPQHEQYWGNVNPIGVRSIYDEAKRYGEALVQLYTREYHLSTRTIRIFNTYGPRMDPEDGRVVTNLMFQALRGEKLTVYGQGTQTRSFQYVSDLVEGIVRLMGVRSSEPVNLGNPDEFTILEFAKKVCQLTQRSEVDIVYKPLPSDDPKQRKPDITRAQSLLGWSPKVKLDEGLARTLSAFKLEL